MRPEEAVQEAGTISGGLSADTIIPGIITLIFSGVIIYIIRAFLIKSLRRNDKLDEQQKVHFVRRVTAVLSILAVLIVIGGYGMKTSTLIALMGVVGLALSLSAQGLLSNFFSGCILAVTRPFSEGDVIEVCGKTGVIERIGYLNTTIVTLENVSITVSNSSLTNGTIVNYSAKEKLLVELTFTVAASMPDEKVRKAFLEAIGKDPRILTDSDPSIRLQSFDSINATYIVSVPCRSEDYYDVYYTVVENVHASFVEHSIEMGTEMFGMRSAGPNGGPGGTLQQAGGSGQQPGGAEGGRGGSGQQAGGMGGGRGGNGQQQAGGLGGGRGGNGQQRGGTGGGEA